MRAFLAGLALAAGLLPGAGVASEFEQRVAAEPGGTLRVELAGGSLVIETHDQDEVRVDALAAGVRRGSLQMELSSRDDEVHLRGSTGGLLASLVGDPRVHVRVRVPREFSLDVRTAGGSVELEHLEGEVKVRTSGGSIDVGRIVGEVDLETSGGSIEAREIEGELRARTSGGPIRIFDVSGRVEARTSGAPIEILDAGESVRARTSGGSITVRFGGAPAGTVETSGGNVEVEFSEDEGLELEARTSGGKVELDPTIEIGGQVAPTRVDAALNGGGERLAVRTSGGNIRLHVR